MSDKSDKLDKPDLWQLDIDQPNWLEPIITALLSNGVPPTVIAKTFSLDVSIVKDMLRETRVTKYGTSEISEAMYFLIWKAYEDALSIIDHSPISVRMRFDMNLLARASLLVKGQTPDDLQKMQDDFSKFIAEIQADVQPDTSIYNTTPPTSEIQEDE